MRRGIAIVAALSAILLVAGCTPKFDRITGKTKGADKVKVKFTICVRDISEDVCVDEAQPRKRGESQLRHLIAIRAPKGTDVPDKFKTVSTSKDGVTIRYNHSRQYSNQMRKKAPTPDGTKWYGFISKPLATAPDRAKYKLIMGLPDDPGKKFKYRPVTGFAGTDPGQDKVNCGQSIFGGEDNGGNAICASDPTTRKEVRKSLKIKLD